MEAGVVEALQAARGFSAHWSGATGSGYRVIELGESREDHRAWYDGTIAPDLPAGVEPMPPDVFELHFEINAAG